MPIYTTLEIQFTKEVITVPYKKEEKKFEVHFRPLWDWALDLVKNPQLAPFFHWDSCRLFKWTNNRWMRFINEPWTANAWWNVQVSRDTIVY